MRHFLRMLLKGSVNANELLWLDRSQMALDLPPFDRLREYRNDLFSQRLWDAWNGVLRAYGHELDRPGRLVGAVRRKHLSHVARFAIGLRHAVTTNQIVIRLPEVNYLRSVRAGEVPEEDVIHNAQMDAGIAEQQYQRRAWPKRPRLDRIEALMVNERIARLNLPC